MSDPIETVNQQGTKIRTRKASNETTAQWVYRHFQNVVSEWESEQFPLTNELCTCWLDAADEAHCQCTTRGDSESDNDFLARHADEASTAMLENPPAP